MITREGIEGGAIYALSAHLRDAIEIQGDAVLHVDLAPDMAMDKLAARLNASPGQSVSNRLRRAGLPPLAASLLREGAGAPPADAVQLAAAIKDHRIRLTGTASIARAISTAGGVSWDSLNANYSLRADPSAFVCGEMLDWEAPTGGYLLQACFATGRAAARGALARFNN
jgi:predicted flavoprotein YhiN